MYYTKIYSKLKFITVNTIGLQIFTIIFALQVQTYSQSIEFELEAISGSIRIELLIAKPIIQ